MDNGLWRVILCMLFFPLLCTGLVSFRCLLAVGLRGCGAQSLISSRLCLEPGMLGYMWARGSGRGPTWVKLTPCPKHPPCPLRPPMSPETPHVL